ncbi:MAG TPA: hypothetical protein VNU25_00690 [Candidatus Paceibacterota bacterium]|nr:hypothetical protein [Candidatus Paceibacterota bacterium]
MTTTTKTIALTLGVIAAFAALTLLMFSFTAPVEAYNGGAKSVGSKLEVSIADSGRVIVRGAEVASVSDGVIRAETTWGATALTWYVETDADTSFVTKAGSGSELEDIAVGQYVSFSGMIDGSGTALTVDADAVKNWSLDDDRATSTKAELRAEARAEAKNGWGKFISNLAPFHWFKK